MKTLEEHCYVFVRCYVRLPRTTATEWWKPGIRHTYVNGVSDLGSSVATLSNTNSWLRLYMLLTDSNNYSHAFHKFLTMGKAFPRKCGLLPYPCGLMSSWAFVLWASVLWAFVLWAFVRIPIWVHKRYSGWITLYVILSIEDKGNLFTTSCSVSATVHNIVSYRIGIDDAGLKPLMSTKQNWLGCVCSQANTSRLLRQRTAAEALVYSAQSLNQSDAQSNVIALQVLNCAENVTFCSVVWGYSQLHTAILLLLFIPSKWPAYLRS